MTVGLSKNAISLRHFLCLDDQINRSSTKIGIGQFTHCLAIVGPFAHDQQFQ